MSQNCHWKSTYDYELPTCSSTKISFHIEHTENRMTEEQLSHSCERISSTFEHAYQCMVPKFKRKLEGKCPIPWHCAHNHAETCITFCNACHMVKPKHCFWLLEGDILSTKGNSEHLPMNPFNKLPACTQYPQ